MEYTNIKLEIENGVATIRLNRPDALNALNTEMAEELSGAIADVAKNEGVKALVVRGEGRAFCSGADLIFFESAFNDASQLTPYIKKLNDCFLQLEELPFPVISVVHGFALAGGMELMLACDMTIAAEDARIGDQHANFGLMPGFGSTQRLPRRIGMQRAMELLTTGKWVVRRRSRRLGTCSTGRTCRFPGPGTGGTDRTAAVQEPAGIGLDKISHPAGQRPPVKRGHRPGKRLFR